VTIVAARIADRPNVLKKRGWVAFGCVALGYAGLVGRLLYLQGMEGGATRAMAVARRTGKIPLPARRGAIFDRAGLPCAMSVATANIGFDPSLFARPLGDARKTEMREKQLHDSVALLAGVLGCPEADVAARVQRARTEYPVWMAMKQHRNMNTILQSPRFAVIRENVDADVVARFDAQRLKLNGFSLQDDTRRSYLLGDSGLQVVGYVNDYGKPITGLELTCNRWLDRHPGYLVTERDGRGRQIPGTETRTETPLDGADVHLALDTSVQKIVRQELQTAFAKYRPTGAEAIVVDPATGDVLAMVSLPTFDPNQGARRPAGAGANIGEYQFDRCACRVYEPGSTLKTIAIASAIDRGIITPDTYFHCGGGLRVNNRTIHDSHSEVHGDLRPEDILRYSCNVCTAQIGMKMGLPDLYAAARQFGLGAPLDTHLPMEQRGRMRLPEPRQYAAQAARVAFGQAITTTPLHLAMAYAAIANGGVLMKPRLVTELKRGDRVLQEWEPQKVRQAVSARTSEQMMHMLQAVISNGTGRAAAVRGYTVAGKTGTASKYRAGAYVGSFIGVIPAAPTAKFRAVILVAIDEPHGAFYGAEVAAPVFQQIATRLMSLKGVAEDDPAWTQFKAAHSPVHGEL
jgi:stage V sporulation protein D (sporulation-specific penicillin-binding protein)